MDSETPAHLRGFLDGFRWDAVPLHPYKEDAEAPFRAITRQTLFNDPGFGCELRYFEMEVGGHSSLERHEHMHAVMILRGSGHCLLGRDVRAIKPFDLVTIPPWVWHQFRATRGEPLRFLCMVNQQRDRPVLPSPEEQAEMARDPTVAAFLAGMTAV